MSADAILSLAVTFAFTVLSLALLLTVARIIRGPSLPDRVLGLDMLVAATIGLIAVVAIRTGFNLYIDIALALGLVGFLATIAFARFILSRAKAPASGRDPAPAGGPAGRKRASNRHRRGRS